MPVLVPTDRFQSFAERYLIERAGHYRDGNEKEDAWKALQDAKAIYDMIDDATQVRNCVAAPYVQQGKATSQAGVPSPGEQKAAALQAMLSSHGAPYPASGRSNI